MRLLVRVLLYRRHWLLHELKHTGLSILYLRCCHPSPWLWGLLLICLQPRIGFTDEALVVVEVPLRDSRVTAEGQVRFLGHIGDDRNQRWVRQSGEAATMSLLRVVLVARRVLRYSIVGGASSAKPGLMR